MGDVPYGKFELLGRPAMIDMDPWLFMLEFAEDSVRDQVLEDLKELPVGYFDSDPEIIGVNKTWRQ